MSGSTNGADQLRDDIPNASEDSDQWSALRKDVLDRDGYECRFCGVTNEEHQEEYKQGLHAHHIIPDSDGGDTSMQNLITVCLSCHHTLEMTHARAVAQLDSEEDADDSSEDSHEDTDWNAVAAIRSSRWRQQVIEAIEEEPRYSSEIADDLDTTMERVTDQINWLKRNDLVQCLTPDRVHHRIYGLTRQGKSVLEKV